VLEGNVQARQILEENRESLVRLAEALLEYETLDFQEITKVVKGEKIRQEELEAAEVADTVEPGEESDREETVSPLVNPKERPAPA
jgi:hypothetical protein